jgi:hypothetical protein
MLEPEVIQALQQRPIKPHVDHLVFYRRFHIWSIHDTSDMLKRHYLINAVSPSISPDPLLPNRNFAD